MRDPPPRSSLDFEIRLPADAVDGATVVVLLHGRGSHKGDLQNLAPLLPPEWIVVTPEAPFPGALWGYGMGSAWYRYIDGDRVASSTLGESLGKLDGFLRSLPDIAGLEPGRTVLGGFSQGGTVSMAYALTRPASVAAVWNFSGFLAADVVLDETGAAPPSTPIFWGHGLKDPAIPIELADSGRVRLRRAGANLVTKDYRIGHWIVAQEVEDALAMLDDEV